MNNLIDMYRYSDTFYTGTEIQPDTLTFFIQSQNASHVCHAESSANILGRSLFLMGSFCGLGRVSESIQSIARRVFNRSTPPIGSHWNACKNLFRGIVEVCPLSGLTLFIYDSVKNAIYFSRIKSQIQAENEIVGLGIDGKLIFTLSLAQLEKIHPKLAERPALYQLSVFKHLCTELLKRKDSSGESIPFIFQQFKRYIEEKEQSS